MVPRVLLLYPYLFLPSLSPPIPVYEWLRSPSVCFSCNRHHLSLHSVTLPAMWFSRPLEIPSRILHKRCCQVLLITASLLLVPFILLSVSTGISLFQPPPSPVWRDKLSLLQAHTPRVVFVVVQTHHSLGWCRMLLSSVLSNVTVITVGFGADYSHTARPQWVLDYINDVDLRDDDVVVVFGAADTFFTGPLSVQRAVKHFIATTAPTPAAFNAKKVHLGKATAPVIVLH